MSAETISFRAETWGRALDELARRPAPVRARVFLEGGPARELAGEVVLRVAGGLVVGVEVAGPGPAITGARALMRAFLAEEGRIELRADEIGPSDRPGPRLVALAAEAEAAALALTALVASLGGLAGILAPDLDSLVEQLASLPDAVSGVLRLADGARSVAAILRDSPYDELLTARILERLRQSGILHLAPTPTIAPAATRQVLVDDPAPPVAPAAPEPRTGWDPSASAPAEPSVVANVTALPSEDELEGDGVEDDIRTWLEHEHVPEPLLSADAFERAFAVAEPELALPHPEVVETERPSPHLVEAAAAAVLSGAVTAGAPVMAAAQVAAATPVGAAASVATAAPQVVTATPVVAAAQVVTATPVVTAAPVVAATPVVAAPAPSPEAAPSSGPSPEVASAAAIPVARPAVPSAAPAAQPRAARRAPPPPDPGPTRAVLVGALVVLVAIALAWSLARDRAEERPPEVVPEPAPRAAVPTTTTASVAVAEPTSPRGGRVEVGQAHVVPSIAGPNAPEEVKRAEALLDAGQYWDAGRILAGLRESRATDPSVWVLSGQLCVDSGGRFAEALAHAERALAVDPRFYRAWVLKGSALQFLGRRGPAAEAYQRALALEPGHPMSAELATVLRQLQSGR